MTNWYAPRYPRSDAVLKVLPARPLHQGDPVRLLDQLVHDDLPAFVTEQPIARKPADHPQLCGVLARALGHFPSGGRT